MRLSLFLTPSFFVRRSIAGLVTAAFLVGCGGGKHGSMPPTASPAYTGTLASATILLTIPGPTTSATVRKPLYVSSATKSLQFTLNSATELTAGQVTAYNALGLGLFNTGTLPSATCVTFGSDFLCTLKIQLPPGSDNITLTAYDATNATGNILSSQTQTLAISAAVANNLTMTLDAAAATMAITPPSGFCASSANVVANQTVQVIGTGVNTFDVSYTDPAGKTIVGPGLPKLEINGSSTSGTVTGTGGNVAFSINQSAQIFTLTPTTSSTLATISVTAVPPNSAGGSDGLSFSQALSYKIQSSEAEPSSFFADAEQEYNSSDVVTGGELHFWTVALGSSSDSFNAASPSSLTDLSNDVDFPRGLAFDGNGDLLLANYGSTSGDTGNFACVPAGAVVSGTNSATVITTNVTNPTGLAVGTDDSVALANGGSTLALLTFTQSGSGGSYANAPSRNIPVSSHGGVGTVVALPTTAVDPAGSYAVSFPGSTYQTSNVYIVHPNGTSYQIPQDPDDINDQITYDPANNQLVLAGGNGYGPVSSHITFWSLTTTGSLLATKVKDFAINVDGIGDGIGLGGQGIFASSAGYIAFPAFVDDGDNLMIVYDNTPARNMVGAPIDYTGTTTSGGSTFNYGGASVAQNSGTAITWLTGTKFVYGLISEGGSNQATTANGLYIYDVTKVTQTQTGYDFGDGQALPSPTIKQTGFQALPFLPDSTAYKP